MMLLLAFILSFAGLLSIALTMARYQRQVWRYCLPSQCLLYMLRAGGVMSLTAAVVPCIHDGKWGPGIVMWSGLLTVCALLVAILISYRASALAN
ncbi:MAG TPA: DUF3325 domain-containing protein [Pusillimonas sp.]|jgi:hypothetical protein|nr:DUF3325 domain-containing protein [Pusillimonas sp.]|tara:strand:+ start:30383 stop:30667 length:285 start_codon:yes stop_codon:yes gene_type:complete